jgi:acetoin utilization protein AcuB
MNETIRHFMTRLPHTIEIGRTLADAHRLMRQHRIRHLPVLEHGKLVGVVSERDLHLLETLRDVDPNEVTVEEAMSPDVFAVRSNAALANVARVMAERKYGSAVVVSGSEVLGIFTAIDSLRILAELVKNPARVKSSKTAARRGVKRPPTVQRVAGRL